MNLGKIARHQIGLDQRDALHRIAHPQQARRVARAIAFEDPDRVAVRMGERGLQAGQGDVRSHALVGMAVGDLHPAVVERVAVFQPGIFDALAHPALQPIAMEQVADRLRRGQRQILVPEAARDVAIIRLRQQGADIARGVGERAVPVIFAQMVDDAALHDAVSRAANGATEWHGPSGGDLGDEIARAALQRLQAPVEPVEAAAHAVDLGGDGFARFRRPRR
ncbi:hypothetical protein WR25_09978 [Diploscapter pachys]|uniref:Uncharacterized protein n=1 Tax=Diploscapter pachys TaxID=2018661 RepID=A0A2A2M3F4_9BILA|nr:hypothetical protein WR25_09978 [Diploscapter pachys]